MTNGRPDTLAHAQYRKVALAEPSVTVENLARGGMILRSNDTLREYHRQVGIPLRHWAGTSPDRIFLAERDSTAAWREVTYAEARRRCDSISQALLERCLGPERPVVILSDNSINFALLSLAAMQVGIPVSPVSPSYSLLSSDFSKLRRIVEMLTPAVLYVEDGVRFENALKAIDLRDTELLVTRNPPSGIRATAFEELLSTVAGPAVNEAFDRVAPYDTAKILFTSGSTGTPKAVINTHRMLCANQQMNAQTLEFLTDQPPVMVEWLPWNHTAAGNQIFNMILFHGGSYFIDDGRPVPGRFDQTIRNLRDIAPTAYFNVPTGFTALLPHLERDKAFRDHFFRDLIFVWYAGAALTQDLWDRFEQVAYQATGERVVMTSGYGATESAPSLTFAHWPNSRLGNVGLPLPGLEVKLAPVGDKLEVRARGPTISPGYYKDPALTENCRDEDGFYRFGDAMKLLDPAHPERGTLFDGRISENFKLSTGTWVGVGNLRTEVIAAAAPAIQDLIVCGHDRDYVAVLAWPALGGCRDVSGLGQDTEMADLIESPKVRAHIAERLSAFNESAGGSSKRIGRVMLMEEPPKIDANEITDKGYINQRTALARRADLVAELFGVVPSRRVIEIG